MKKYRIIPILFLLATKLFGQEIDLPQYVNHMADNPFLISPAYAGIGSGLQVRLNGVSQWIGVENAPDTQSLSLEARLAERFGGGLTMFNDQNGFTSQKGVRLSLASHLTLSNVYDSFLSFGLSYSFIQFGIDTSENNTPQPVPDRVLNSSNFDISMLYRFDRFAFSANVVNLLDKNIEDFSTGEPRVLRRYSVYTNYNHRINRDTELEPSAFVEYFEASKRSRTDLNVKLRKKIFNGYVWGGLSYTFLNDQFFTPNAIAPLFGIKKDKFYVSYGFSITVNEIVGFNNGTHMITLGFDYDRRPSLARCTRKMIMF
ncbi:type IX secretion system PorP/SprF family membrane protein [Tenacibaculum skagerrakense]|uniref:Type IX secretion system PorP/SprF family membrane protein n=1 Tax=Tenacibaculum skagerrakense TaxID=186571 RepID=A0A4R2NIV3_9FLAO|nr:type IX secretion system membrane protein PorP/SprF [Tenacibaculum skagerrakense]TCP21469.1 type IX secretion system PorP/SprF family membrane protein [Tenacibaculum skagerrakense]